MRALIGWNSVLYQRTEYRLMTWAGFQSFASSFWQICPKLNIPSAWLLQKNESERFVSSTYGSRRPLLTTVVEKLYENNKFCEIPTNKQILSLTISSMKDIVIYYEGRNYA